MNKPWFDIGVLGILGALLFIAVEVGIYMIGASKDWKDRLTCSLLILFLICLAGILVYFFGGEMIKDCFGGGE